MTARGLPPSAAPDLAGTSTIGSSNGKTTTPRPAVAERGAEDSAESACHMDMQSVS